MLPGYSTRRRPKKSDGDTATLLHEVSPERLHAFVDMLAFPRHYVAQKKANVRARDLLLKLLANMGHAPQLHGSYDNIIVRLGEGPYLVLGAHYDSVPSTPGADDNASAVAVCLECARLLRPSPANGVMIVFFNREEDGLLGSTEFVDDLARKDPSSVTEAHIFEMVGFLNRAPASQRMPPGIPGFLAPKVGDFLALLANRDSNSIAEKLLNLAATYIPQSPVVALKVYLGLERYIPHLHRSDHAPFWQARIPAIMWTDTSEFRNPNYHRATDTAETLDFAFMAQVAKLALARVVSRQ